MKQPSCPGVSQYSVKLKNKDSKSGNEQFLYPLVSQHSNLVARNLKNNSP